MIAEQELRAETERAREEKRASNFLSQFVLKIAHEVLIEEYGANYSTRCLQASIVTQTILQQIGIRSRVFAGAVCVPRVSKGNPFSIGWAGFWGEDHHAWLCTEFHELIDLTISQLHIHPASSVASAEPMPAMWWYPIDVWPSIIKYLPEGVAGLDLNEEESRQLSRLTTSVPRVKDVVMSECGWSNGLFGSVLYGPDHLQEMTKAGDPWLAKALMIQEQEFPLPLWVVAREQELIKRHSRRG